MTGSTENGFMSSVLRINININIDTNASTAVQSCCEKTARWRGGSRKLRLLQLRLFPFGSNILYLWYIFNSNIDIVSFLKQSSTVFIHVACFLNSQDIFKERHLSHIGAAMPDRSGVFTSFSRGEASEANFFLRPVSWWLLCLPMCIQFRKIETLI